MYSQFRAFIFCLLTGAVCHAAAIPSGATPSLPQETQQLISIDNREVRNSGLASEEMKKLVPDDVRQLLSGLSAAGIPDKDLDQTLFATYRTGDDALGLIGYVQAQMTQRTVVTGLKVRGAHVSKQRTHFVYTLPNGMRLSFLNPSTIVFGDKTSLKAALDAVDGERQRFALRSELASMAAEVQSKPVWSVLDKRGAQEMFRSVLGSAAPIASLDAVKNRILGSAYGVDLAHGVSMEMKVNTPDTITAGSLASLMKAALMFERVHVSTSDRPLLDSIMVDTNRQQVVVRFRTDDSGARKLQDSTFMARLVQ